ncbi:hypothetical protein QBC43DRAFT_108986 [Cladorrhinum sp. PSN259]|nr:hypothetical protein QBC43DRAFT_108986 [Cladorrhinum sp. PSN259]
MGVCSLDHVPTFSRPKKPSFLSLPAEIRLKVYAHLVHSCPLPPPPDLAPGYPSPSPNNTGCVYTQLVGSAASSSSRLLSAHRPLGYIPTSFLLSCRQVYYESRVIPFQENEFVFQSFFASGLVPAGVFVRRMEIWQRKEVRWVRIELRAEDLGFCGSKKGDDGVSEYGEMKKWVEVCEGLKDARGMRLRVDFRGWKRSMGHIEEVVAGEGMLREDGRWVDEGLKRMKQLRWLEIEVVNLGMEDKGMFEWCKWVEGRLNMGRGNAERTVRIIAVRRVEGKKERCV